MNNNVDFSEHNMQEELKRAQRELAILYDVSNAMRTTLELEPVLHVILTGVTAHKGLGFNRAVLFLVNNKDRVLEARMAIGPESGEHAQKVWDFIDRTDQNIEDLISEEKVFENTKKSSLFNSIKNMKIPLHEKDHYLLSHVYREAKSVVANQTILEKFPHDPLIKMFQSNQIVVVPLKAKDKVNGIIVADNIYTKKEVSESDLRIFTMLANQAGLAIENSRLYEMVNQKAQTDALTGLWNHGFFQEKIEKEIAISEKQRSALSLVILDIDNFKKLNDTFGHQYGDIILKNISDILKDSSRDRDFACRYGGEEFTIILTETNKQQAFQIAERIRKNIAEFNFPPPNENNPQIITVSVGISSFPEDAQDKSILIKKADKAMYIAKFSGKNQTCIAE